MPVIEEYKEPDPTWEEDTADVLDQLYDDSFVNRYKGIMVTTSHANGLIV